MATNLVKAKKEVKEMKSTKGREVVGEEGRSMDIFAPAWVQNNARVLKAKTSPPKTGSEDDKEKENKTVKDEKEAGEVKKVKEKGEGSLDMFAPAWVQENTKVLKSKAASKVSSSEEKDDNPGGQSGKALEEIVEGLELAELDQVLYIMPPTIDKYDI